MLFFWKKFKAENLFVHRTRFPKLLFDKSALQSMVDDEKKLEEENIKNSNNSPSSSSCSSSLTSKSPPRVPRLRLPRSVQRVALGDFGESKGLTKANKRQLTFNVGTPEVILFIFVCLFVFFLKKRGTPKKIQDFYLFVHYFIFEKKRNFKK